MVDIWPFYGTRPYNQDAKNLIAPSTDHLSIENIEIFRKNNLSKNSKKYNQIVQHVGKNSGDIPTAQALYKDEFQSRVIRHRPSNVIR